MLRAPCMSAILIASREALPWLPPKRRNRSANDDGASNAFRSAWRNPVSWSPDEGVPAIRRNRDLRSPLLIYPPSQFELPDCACSSFRRIVCLAAVG